MSARRGSQRIERLPSARGPHSIRPWNQPTTWPSAMPLRGSPAEPPPRRRCAGSCSRRRRRRRALRSISALDLGVAELPGRGRRGPSRSVAGWPSTSFQTAQAAPIAPPASPAAAWTERSRERRCARRPCRWRPSSCAQPPARQSARSPRLPLRPGSSRWKNASSYIACSEAARSLCRASIGSSGARGGPSRSTIASREDPADRRRAAVPDHLHALGMMAEAVEIELDSRRRAAAGRCGASRPCRLGSP